MARMSPETRRATAADGTRLAYRVVGQGAPLVLLHGYPQNHRCWLPVLPALAARFRCILPDLRGYGDSAAPEDDADHASYSKRVMARDVGAILDAEGIARAHVAGHDRGARVAYRLALDLPQRVGRLVVIDVIPTSAFWEAWTADLSMKAYHWTFLAQPAPLPERMIGADPAAYVDWTLASWTRCGTLGPFEPTALASYRAQMAEPARLAAMCADYRAGYHVDRAVDLADRAAGRTIAAPMLFLWGEGGFPARSGDPLGIWRAWAPGVAGHALPSGHFAMEEAPEAVARAMLGFLGA
jgi:haloacetate dehalogenase